MQKQKQNFNLMVAALLAVLMLALPLTAGAQKPDRSQQGRIHAGEVVVKFKPVVGQQTGKQRLQKEGIKIKKALPRSGLLRLEVPPGSEQQTIDMLLARSDVEFATFNHAVEAFETPSDPYYTLGYQWAIDKIELPAAWNISHGEASITVAVIDTGADLDHPDLAAKIWVNAGEVAGNGIDDDGNGYVDDVNGYDFYNYDAIPDDDNSHGSHVAGIVAASTNNGAGIAGVSWGARIMPLKALSSTGGGSTADVAEAIYYAADNGAQIVNLSLGASGTAWPCGWTDVEDAFSYAASRGVLLVVAAGNDGKYGVSCPAAYPLALAVGSTTSSDTRSYFSNYGPRLEIVAPGSSIYSTWSNGSYGYKSGTSMATPYVAGLAALLWGMDANLTADEVRATLKNTADDLGDPGWDMYFGDGRINAYRALEPYLHNLTLSTAGSEIIMPLIFLTDDQTDPMPATQTVEISTQLTGVITWTATVSPTVDWLSLSAGSGQVSVASAGQFDVTAARPQAYGDFTTNLVVSGTTATGLAVGPTSKEVRISYVPQLTRLILPVIYK